MIRAQRGNRNENYRLNHQLELKVRSPPQKIFQPPLAVLPLVNDAAEPPAENRREQSGQAVVIEEEAAERNEAQNQKISSADSSDKVSDLFHGTHLNFLWLRARSWSRKNVRTS